MRGRKSGWRTIPGPYTNESGLTSIEAALNETQFRKGLATLSESKPEKVDAILKTNRLIFLQVLSALYDLGWVPKLNEKFDVKQFCQEFRIQTYPVPPIGLLLLYHF